MIGTERYVVLGLALPRSAWFRDVTQWAHTGLLPIEFVKCVSIEELRARLGSARAHSAVLLDIGLPGVDRDLVDAVRRSDCAMIAVGSAGPSARALDFDASLPSRFAPGELTGALVTHAQPIGRADVLPGLLAEEPAAGWRGSTVAVCGPGGTGTSTIAIALGQGLADTGKTTLLVDLCLRGEQAMLHGAPDDGPGVQELAEAHRVAMLGPDEILGMTWQVEARGYHLLVGLRRRRSWTSVRPRAFELAFDGLRGAFDAVVADIDDDLEGETEGGSVDVEERHVMARTAVRFADVVVVVGAPGMKGVRATLAVLAELVEFGVPVERLVPVINQAPRAPRARAEITRALGELGKGIAEGLPGPLFLPRRQIDPVLRDGVRMPVPLTAPLVGAYQTVIDRVGCRPSQMQPPIALLPGSIGSWSA